MNNYTGSKSNKNNAKFSDGNLFENNNGRSWKLAEVFTPKSVVDTMLKQAKITNASFDATFFEPGAGTGNFISEILWFKINQVFEDLKNKKIKNKLIEYEVISLLSLASITYNDIDKSNIDHIKKRLFKIMEMKYLYFLNKFKYKIKKIPEYYKKAIKNILSANAILADFLNNTDDLMFVRYQRLPFNKILRSVYKFAQLKLITSKNITLFDNYEPIYEDDVDHTNWTLEIDGKNIEELNQRSKNNF